MVCCPSCLTENHASQPGRSTDDTVSREAGEILPKEEDEAVDCTASNFGHDQSHSSSDESPVKVMHRVAVPETEQRLPLSREIPEKPGIRPSLPEDPLKYYKQSSPPNVTIQPPAHHPHLLPYLYPGYAGTTPGMPFPLGQFLLPTTHALTSSGHSLPHHFAGLSSQHHPGLAAMSQAMSHLPQSTSHGSHQMGLGFLNPQFLANHPLFHQGFAGLGGHATTSTSTLASSLASSLASYSPHRFNPYSFPLTSTTMVTTSNPLISTGETRVCALSPSVSEPSPTSSISSHSFPTSPMHRSPQRSSPTATVSKSAESQIRSIEQMVNGIERTREQRPPSRPDEGK